MEFPPAIQAICFSTRNGCALLEQKHRLASHKRFCSRVIRGDRLAAEPRPDIGSMTPLGDHL